MLSSFREIDIYGMLFHGKGIPIREKDDLFETNWIDYYEGTRDEEGTNIVVSISSDESNTHHNVRIYKEIESHGRRIGQE